MTTATRADYYSFYTRHIPPIREYAPGKYKGICPLHGDSDPSFDVDWNKGTWYCHGACKRGGNAVQLAKELGVPVDQAPSERPLIEKPSYLDRPPKSPPPSPPKKHHDPWRDSKIVAEYPFTDENGKYLFHEVKFEPKDFRLAIKNGKGWIKSLDSLGERKRILYRLPEFIHHTSDHAWICEGPKDADRLIELGFRATTCPMGSGNWHRGYGEYLRGSHVIVPIDNDPAGEKFGAQVQDSCQGKALSCVILRLPGLPEKGDVSDWLDMGHTAAELITLIQEQPKPKTKIDHIEPIDNLLKREFTEAPWLIEKIWPYGARGLIAGNPGSNKTWFAMELAYSITTGDRFLGEFAVPEPGKVLYIQQELNEKHHKERWELMLPTKPDDEARQKFAENLYHLTSQQLILPEDTEDLIKYLKDKDFKAVIIDSLSETHLVNENSAHEMRPILMALTKIRNETKASVIVIHHLHKSSKDSKSRSIFERIRGSSAIWGWRNAIIAMSTEDQDEFKSRVQFQFQVAETPAEFVFLRDRTNDGFIFNKQDITQTERFQDQCDKIYEYLEKQEKTTSFNSINRHVGGKRDNNRKAIQMMISMGTIIKEANGYRIKDDLVSETTTTT